MKLLVGVLSYLAVVAAVIVAVFVGVSSIERSKPQNAPVLAHSDDDSASKRSRAIEEMRVDPNRVPVWIAATAKYEYTPVPVDTRPKHSTVIGRDGRGALAKGDPRHDGRRAIESALRDRPRDTGRSLGFAPTRDNDPFFRD